MRRLAERPQNLALAYQEFVSTKTLKKIGVFTSLGLGAFIISGLTRLLKDKNKSSTLLILCRGFVF